MVFPSSSSVIRRSPSLRGVPRVGSPASPVQRERSDFPRPSRLASLRSALPPKHLSFAPTSARCLPAWAVALVAGWPPAGCRWRQRDLPGSWTNPCDRAALSDPGRTFVPGHFDASVLPSLRPRSTGSFVEDCFGVQSRGSFARWLRFAAWIAPSPRKTRFATGGQPLPGGPLTHWARSREVSRWLRHRSSSPRLNLAQGTESPI